MGFSLALRMAFRHYLQNFSTVLGFGLLLVFVFLFAQFSGVFISSGSVFVSYSVFGGNLFFLLAMFLSVLVFLFFYSVFVCLMVFAVRNHLSKVKLNYYLTQKIRKFAVKYFVFSVVFSVVAFLLVLLSNIFNLPGFLVFFVLFAGFSFLSFVPQSVVVDENSIFGSIVNNFEFISKNFSGFVFILLVGMFLVFLLVLAEFLFATLLFAGNIFSLLLALFFVVPFMEVLKTHFYMKKFSLIRFE